MSQESIINVDVSLPYAALRPVVVEHCQRVAGAWETLGALAKLVGELIASAPTAEVRDALEADATLLIKKYILLTPAPASTAVMLADDGPSTLSH